MFFNTSKFYSIILLLMYLLGSAFGESKEGVSEEFVTEPQKSPSEETIADEVVKVLEDATTKELLEEIDEITSEIAKNEEVAEEIEEAAEEEEEEKIIEKESTTAVEETGQKTEVSTSIPKTTPSKEKSETTSALPMLVTETGMEKEEAPKDTYAVWNSKGKICLLAQFHAVFSIIYSSNGGEEKVEVRVPKDANSKGKCESTTRSPLLQVSWPKYSFTMMFNKSEEDNWFVSSMELTYDTSEPLFDGATNAGKKTARSKAVNLFETPLKKSYFCPAKEVVLLYTGKKQVVTARIEDLHLQPYEVENGEFSPVQRCNKVMIGLEETPFVQDETVPLAVGCTLALITLIILVGFSVHRAYNAAKVDYNTME